MSSGSFFDFQSDDISLNVWQKLMYLSFYSFRRILSYCFPVTFFGLMTPKTVSVQTISILFSFIHTILSVVHYNNVPQNYIIARTTINTVLLLVLLSEVSFNLPLIILSVIFTFSQQQSKFMPLSIINSPETYIARS